MHHQTLLSAILFLPTVLNAQREPLTLEAARAEARTAHPTVRSSHADADAAHAVARSRGFLNNPVLAIDRESTGGGELGDSELIFRLEQPLDLWGARSAGRSADILRAAAADVRAAASVAALDERVALEFADAIAAGWDVTAAEGRLATFDRALTILTERRDAGDASGLDVIRVRLERTGALARLVSTRHDRHTARARLAALMVTPVAALDSVELVLHVSPAQLPTLTIDSLLRAAHRVPSDASALELEHQAAATATTAATRARIPVPSVRVGGKWVSSADGPRRGGLVVGLSVPLPVWRSGNAEVDHALAAEVSAEARWEASRLELELDVQDTWETLHEHAAPIAELTEALEANGPTMRDAIDVSFSEGELDVTAWLDALRTEYETRTLYNELWSDLVARMAHLERLTGLNFLRGTS